MFVAAAAVEHAPASKAPHLVFDWLPGGGPEALADAIRLLAAKVSGPVEGALCPHPGGPPSAGAGRRCQGCYSRSRGAHGVDLSRSTLMGASPAHKTLATTLGARYVPV